MDELLNSQWPEPTTGTPAAPADADAPVQPYAPKLGPAEDAYSAGLAGLSAWIMPATTTRRTTGLALWRAYLVHLIAAVATFLLIVLLVWIGEGFNICSRSRLGG